ncbi:putative 4-coumarate--CoA ligase 3 [Toxocara canis]|uniref:Putative 4-coumarate--CoA ligase 3 n=1 Tax=Toxocara canis TaxID=6265 RepID=A0A0B2UQK0_TOXCA|nr:putative 4-coumarate--CoA ligase 3 [Toxocara canis]
MAQQRNDFLTYGMTELGGLCTLSHFGCDNLASVGVPLPGMLVKVVHWETKELSAPNQVGQLLVMGPQVQPAFYKNPKATNDITDSLGYLKTGDAAYYDEDGYIYILDRMKDLIKYKGALVKNIVK